jgi:hypothetical protein
MKKIILFGFLVMTSSAFAGEQVLFKSGNVINELYDSYEVTLTGTSKIPDSSFNSLWSHVPYPIKSYTFEIPKADCFSILECKSSEYVHISEIHTSGQEVHRIARMSYQVRQAGEKLEFFINFENQKGQQLTYTFNYSYLDVIRSN